VVDAADAVFSHTLFAVYYVVDFGQCSDTVVFPCPVVVITLWTAPSLIHTYVVSRRLSRRLLDRPQATGNNTINTTWQPLNDSIPYHLSFFDIIKIQAVITNVNQPYCSSFI